MAEVIHRMLERNARKLPDDMAVRFPGGDVTWSWRQLNERANAAAHLLMEWGIRPGDRVGLLIPNRPEFIQVYFGALKAGAAVVPINAKLTAGEVAHILADSEAAVLIYDPALRAAGEDAASRAGTPRLLPADELDKLTAGLSTADPDVAVDVADLAELLYTSGTTGRPKGVEITHHAVHSVASMMAYEIDIRRGDRVLLLMPLTHSAPLNLLMVGAVYAGAGSVVGEFSPQALLDFTVAERTTHFFGAPVAYLLASRLPQFAGTDLSSAKCWVYGGAPMSREAVRMVQSKFPGALVGVYGLTESGPNGLALHHEEHGEFAGSIGRGGVVNVEARVVNGAGHDTQADEPGEIVLRAPSLMRGYWRNEAATREVLKDGWLWTGDIARRDGHGYIWIMDRKKDVIISGGVNVYPKEVEDALGSHPAVADVAVIGKPHPDWGETVVAVVMLRPGQAVTEEELRAHARDRLADFKVPRLIQFAESVPRNASGKILKHLLREGLR
ncbi:MAG: class I adenylate-forming enzyme family protein [Symbiobacteriia bacterium]